MVSSAKCPKAILEDGQTVAEHRERELEAACRTLGVARGEYLEYKDSGMAGEPTNEDPDMLLAGRPRRGVATGLRPSSKKSRPTSSPPTTSTAATAIPTTSRSTASAYERPRSPEPRSVFLATLNRDRVQELMANAAELGVESLDDERGLDVDTFGEPASRITTAVDVHSLPRSEATGDASRTRARSPRIRSSCPCLTTSSSSCGEPSGS